MWYGEREKKRTEDVMPYQEKLERYFATSPADMEPPIPQHDLSYEAESPAFSYDVTTGNSGDRVEPDAKVGIAKMIEYQSLIQTQAFQWLLTRLQRELHLTASQPDNQSIVREHILSGMPTSDKVSRSQPVETCTAVFHMDWDPRAFVKEQHYLERLDEAIATAITITGDPTCAQALTTAEYLDQTWPVSGQWMLQVLKDVVMTGSGYLNSCKC
jgi:hypothetical protein